MGAAQELDKVVAFDARPDDAANAYGGVPGAFVERFRVAARQQNLRGGEEVTAARLAGRQPVLFRVRQSSLTRQIAPDWRARDTRSGAAYNIRSSIDPFEHVAGQRGRWLDILCESGVAI